MNATGYTAQVTAQHRAATLDRENELLRSHAEMRAAARPVRSTPVGLITHWLSGIAHRIATPRIRPA